MLKTCLTLLALSAATALAAPATQPAQSFAVSIHIDATRTLGPLKPIWRFFGADEPNYATFPDGQKLLADIGQLAPDQAYFRTHNLLTSGNGTPALKWGSTNAYHLGPDGQPVYDWTILDSIFDTYRAHHVRPYVEIGFMPKDLSVRPDPYQHHWTPKAKYDEIYTGWAYPPTDYRRWGDVVAAWAQHAVDRYGRDEVKHWYWEVWNEPNIPYWRGTREEFFKLHDTAIDALRRAFPDARVGGPDSAGGGTPFLRDFLEHCLHGTNAATGQHGTPLDFVSFHAKGSPKFIDGHVRMGISNELRDADRGFAIVASFPELKQTPIVIGECDPDGCAACQGPQLGYRNTTVYSSYTAASFARLYDLADRHQVNLEGALTWAFEFENQPYFAGFRVMASRGLTLPVFNVFRCFSRMSGERLAVDSDSGVPLDTLLKTGVRDHPDVSALAASDHGRIAILLWHYHDDDLPGPTADVTLTLDHLPSGDLHVREFTIDHEHSNAFTAWQQMGSPQNPTAAQYAELERASHLQEKSPPRVVRVPDGGNLPLHLTLPRQAVTLVLLQP